MTKAGRKIHAVSDSLQAIFWQENVMSSATFDPNPPPDIRRRLAAVCAGDHQWADMVSASVNVPTGHGCFPGCGAGTVLGGHAWR